MQCFAQEERWRLDKQGRHFFQAFLVASVLHDASSLRHGSTRRGQPLERRPPAPEELVAPVLAGLPRPRREARREARVEHRE